MNDAPQGVLLLHGMGCGPWVWRSVLPRLSADLTAVPVVIAGHRGGTPLQLRPDRTAPEQMVDDLEDQLDALGIRRIHVVGNSLGGWLALRLAERGRALSVLCLAPAGGWRPGSIGERLIATRFAVGHHVARRTNRTPRLLDSPRVRQAVLAPVVHDPRSITPEDARRFVRDMAECQALRLALGRPDTRQLGRIGVSPAPVTIAWSAADRVLSGPWSRAGFRHVTADVVELRDVGHLPMLDDPGLVAALIEERVGSPYGRRSAS
jgi:pimeloyl-ACP methyl ester carboxylesterase